MPKWNLQKQNWTLQPIREATECHGMEGHRYLSMWPHLTTATITTLPSSPSACTFKVLGLVPHSLAGVAPAYVTDYCQLLSDISRHTLWPSSNDFRMPVVPQIYKKFGNRSYLAASPWLCNELPCQLRRQDLSYPMCRRKLVLIQPLGWINVMFQ